MNTLTKVAILLSTTAITLPTTASPQELELLLPVAQNLSDCKETSFSFEAEGINKTIEISLKKEGDICLYRSGNPELNFIECSLPLDLSKAVSDYFVAANKHFSLSEDEQNKQSIPVLTYKDQVIEDPLVYGLENDLCKIKK